MKSHYVVAVSREHGSSGRRVAKLLAERLGVSYYNKEILRLASEESGISQEIFEKYEAKNSLLYKISEKIYRGEVSHPGTSSFLSGDNLFNYQAKVARTLAQSESYVMVGQCGAFVLQDLPDVDVISVFITADTETKIKNLKERFDKSDSELQRLAEKMDDQRAGYFRYHTGRRWHDVRNYDICVSTSEYTVDEAVELIKNFIEIKRK